MSYAQSKLEDQAAEIERLTKALAEAESAVALAKADARENDRCYAVTRARLSEVERERDALRGKVQMLWQAARDLLVDGALPRSEHGVHLRIAANACYDAAWKGVPGAVEPPPLPPEPAEPRDQPELPSDWQREQKGEYRQGSFYLRLSRGGVWFSSGNDDDGPCCAASVPLNVLRLILRDAGYAPHSGTAERLVAALNRARDDFAAISQPCRESVEIHLAVAGGIARIDTALREAALAGTHTLAASPPDGTAPERALLRRFVDHETDPCRLDHHGYCQEHPGAQKTGQECAVAEGRRLLGATRPPDGMPGEPDAKEPTMPEGTPPELNASVAPPTVSGDMSSKPKERCHSCDLAYPVVFGDRWRCEECGAFGDVVDPSAPPTVPGEPPRDESKPPPGFTPAQEDGWCTLDMEAYVYLRCALSYTDTPPRKMSLARAWEWRDDIVKRFGCAPPTPPRAPVERDESKPPPGWHRDGSSGWYWKGGSGPQDLAGAWRIYDIEHSAARPPVDEAAVRAATLLRSALIESANDPLSQREAKLSIAMREAMHILDPRTPAPTPEEPAE